MAATGGTDTPSGFASGLRTTNGLAEARGNFSCYFMNCLDSGFLVIGTVLTLKLDTMSDSVRYVMTGIIVNVILKQSNHVVARPWWIQEDI